jgi:hypothetical protein
MDLADDEAKEDYFLDGREFLMVSLKTFVRHQAFPSPVGSCDVSPKRLEFSEIRLTAMPAGYPKCDTKRQDLFSAVDSCQY